VCAPRNLGVCDTQTVHPPRRFLDTKWASGTSNCAASSWTKQATASCCPISTAHHQMQCIFISSPYPVSFYSGLRSQDACRSIIDQDRGRDLYKGTGQYSYSRKRSIEVWRSWSAVGIAGSGHSFPDPPRGSSARGVMSWLCCKCSKTRMAFAQNGSPRLTTAKAAQMETQRKFRSMDGMG
jgi:hypothetical protein